MNKKITLEELKDMREAAKNGKDWKTFTKICEMIEEIEFDRINQFYKNIGCFK